MIQRPSRCDRERSVTQPQLIIFKPAAELKQAEPHNGVPDEFSALNSLIQDRGARWSKQARAIKFDIEFKSSEQERKRVAKELHDEILPALARLIRSIQSQGQTQLTSLLVPELHGAVAAFRDLLGELHPVDLEELGLVPALSNICSRHARLTGRNILFVEQDDNCQLSSLQQLCLYRAMQTALKMFADSQNDILLITYTRSNNKSVINLRCIDKSVSSSTWLSPDEQGYDSIESWCGMASAELRPGFDENGDFPSDLVITCSEAQHAPEDTLTLIGQLTQIRLKELDSILAVAQDEWANLINQDCSLFESLAIEAERKRISDDINKLIVPTLHRTIQLAQASNEEIGVQVTQRIKVIAAEVAAVMSELHSRLLAEAGLTASIRTLVDRFRRASLIETTIISNLSSDHIDDLSLSTKFAIYRVIQEALNNIEKHSNATRALVTVKHLTDELIICIEDNGKGFQSRKRTVSRGIKNIRERASEIGAQVAWEKSVSFKTGTLVSISLPLSGHATIG